MRIILLCLCLLGCSKSTPEPQASALELTAIEQRIQSYGSAFPRCIYPSIIGISKDTCLSEGTGSGDADVMLWSGLLCLSGSPIGCDTARASFDINGKAHRSPGRLNDNDFSRDMFLGALAYFVGSRDTVTAQKYLHTIRNGNVCLGGCNLTYATWGAAAIVWRYLGLSLTTEMQIGKQLDELGTLPGALMNEGYQLHLIMVTILLHQKTGTNHAAWKKLAKIVYDKQRSNPFAAYLYLGKTQSVADLTLRSMPVTVPVNRDEWVFEREPGEDWNRSMLWDYYFMYQLLKN